MTMKKFVSSAMALLLAASALAGFASCRKKGAEPVKEKRTNVYAGEEIALPADVEYVNRMVAAGDKAYITYYAIFNVTYNDMGEEVERGAGYDWEEVDKRQESLPEGWWIAYESQYMLGTVDISAKTTTSAPFEFDEETYGYMNADWVPTADGKLITLTQKWEYNEDYTESKNTNYLITVDPTTAEVTSALELNDALVKAGYDAENVYVQNMATSGGDFYLALEGDVVVLGADGSYRSKLDLNLTDGWVNRIGISGDRVVVSYYANGSKIKYFENGAATEIPSDLIGNTGFTACDNENIYINSSLGISAYNFATGEYKEVLNYINSDIANTGNTVFLEDGRLLIASTDWRANGGSVTTLSVYHRVPDEELAEEIILRLGCIYVDYNIRRSIIKFNKQNTGVRVSVVDYSSYNNEDNEWTGAQKQFNNDIATGKLPDIIQLNTSLPVDSYFHKNIFVDLNAYIDDPEKGISRSDLESNILAANQTNGKLLSLILTYSVNTLLAKSEIVGTEAGWTFEEMMKAINSLPEGAKAFYEYSRDSIINSFFTYSMDSFINWETGETYFDTPGFIEFVNYLKTCPEKDYWELRYGEDYVYDPVVDREEEEEYALRFYRNMALFQMGYYSSFGDYLYTLNEFASTDVTAIGYPRQGEGNGAVIVPDIELAISAKSAAKDEAWEVVKFFLSDDEIMNRGWGFSVSRKAMDEVYANAKDSYGDFTLDGGSYDWMREEGYTDEYINFMKNSRQPYSQEAVDYIRGIVENATKIARTDDALVDIVKEDLSAVFAGAKSAEDAARQIASRVGIYVAEHS